MYTKIIKSPMPEVLIRIRIYSILESWVYGTYWIANGEMGRNLRASKL